MKIVTFVSVDRPLYALPSQVCERLDCVWSSFMPAAERVKPELVKAIEYFQKHDEKVVVDFKIIDIPDKSTDWRIMSKKSSIGGLMEYVIYVLDGKIHMVF